MNIYVLLYDNEDPKSISDILPDRVTMELEGNCAVITVPEGSTGDKKLYNTTMKLLMRERDTTAVDSIMRGLKQARPLPWDIDLDVAKETT